MNDEILGKRKTTASSDAFDGARSPGRRRGVRPATGRAWHALPKNSIRKHPFRSIAIGLLAGYVIGKLFSPEDSAHAA
ncbi:MAG: hypothetical protein U5K31_12985 [Balneolaceae bacterium]|nr:hypothetical protein [Balneolaceae bacterium]